MGEIADWMIEQEIERHLRGGDYEYRKLPKTKVTATQVAEGAFEDAENSKKLKDLNKDVIKW